jgi:hypothetical protein
MANFTRRIPKTIKSQLRDEAGGKCANPGCANWRVHFHHIQHWAVYKTHDASKMIAICPSCHDAVHHGRLPISDETLFAWKSAHQGQMPSDTVPLYVAPAPNLRLLAGSMNIQTDHAELTVFELSNRNALRLRIVDGDLLQINSVIRDLTDKAVLRVVENHVRVQRDKAIQFNSYPGRARITMPATGKYVPDWLLAQLAHINYAHDGRVVALDAEVTAPGVISVIGTWASDKHAVVLRPDATYLCRADNAGPATIHGGGTGTIVWTGAIDGRIYGF